MFRSTAAFVCLATALTTSLAAAQDFKPHAWNDLINRPDRWPPNVKITKPLQFQSGAKVDKGASVRVIGVQAGQADVVLPTGNITGLSPDQCDLVDAANAYLSALTPAQRNLNLAAIAKDPTIIPTKVTTFVSFNGYNGKRIAAGDELEVYSTDGNEVVLMTDHRNRTIVDAPHTDILFRARESLAKPEAERPNRVAFWLSGTTINPQGDKVDVKPSDYYIFLICSSTCGRCKLYSPKFLERYKKSYSRRSDVNIITVSNEGRDGSLVNAKDKGFPWPIVPFDDRRLIFNEFSVSLMPGVIVVDKFGRLIANNQGDDAIDSGEKPLNTFDAELVKRGAPATPDLPLGTADNPVRCDMPAGETAYLSRLRCPDGSTPTFERTGGVRTGPSGNSLDIFTINCGGTTSQIFMDMFAAGHIETRPVPGFTITPGK